VPFLEGLLEEEENLFLKAAAVRALGRRGTVEAVEAVVTQGLPALRENPYFLPAVSEALANPLEPGAEAWLLRNGLSREVRTQPESLALVVRAIAGLQNRARFRVLRREVRAAREPATQVAILHVYRDLQPEDAVSDVAPLLGSRDAEVRVATLEVLLEAKALSRTYTRRYVRLLQDSHWAVRLLAIDLIALGGGDDVPRVVTPLLADPDWRVQVAAIAALTATGSRAVIEPLIAALDQSEGRVLDDLVDALTRLTGESVGVSGAQWESWWSQRGNRVEVRRRDAVEFARIKQREGEGQDTAVYHGLRVLSKRCAFVVDTSESMVEEYEYVGEASDAEPASERTRTPRSAARAPATVSGTKLEVAKGELLEVVSRLKEGVLLNVIRFDTLVQPWKAQLAALDASARASVAEFVGTFDANGLTNVFGAIETAFRDERLDTVFLLSDGAPTSGRYVEPAAILARIARLNRFRRVKINTIGFNLAEEEKKLLLDLADANFGVFLSR
jgi:HEAT repeat protein